MESILVRPFPRRPKGRFDKLSARNPITVTASALEKPDLRIRAHAASCYPVWGQVFRPCALGIIGLAIAVALWGFGYKLSLYHCHAVPSSHVPVAKFWIEPRGASVAAASRFKAKSHLVLGSQAFSVSIQRLPRLSLAVSCIQPVYTRCSAFFDFLTPSRAPPPLRFRLA